MGKNDLKAINKDVQRLFQKEGMEVRYYYPGSFKTMVFSGNLSKLCCDFESLGSESFCAHYVAPMVSELFADLKFNHPELFTPK